MIPGLVKRLFSAADKDASENTADAAIPADTEALVAPASTLLQQGRVDEALIALESLLREHHDLAEAHLLLGIVLQGQKQFDDAHDRYTLAECFKPGWWPVYFRLGLLALDRGSPEQGANALRHAIKLGAQDPRVHSALGRAHLESGRVREAVEQFEQALCLDADFAEAHSNLGYTLFHHMEDFESGSKHIKEALRLDPSHLGARCNVCMVLQHEGAIDEAFALCNSLLSKYPDLHEAQVNRASILLSNSKFADGWRDYEARRKWPMYYESEQLPWPYWNGESLADKKMLVYSEQGLGDEIMFASCIPQLLRGAGDCVIECHLKLEHLFRRSFPTATIIRKGELQPSQLLSDPPDFRTGIASLPRFMRNGIDEFPEHHGYLYADPARIEHWRARLGTLPGRLKIGISWRGGAATTRRTLRSIELLSWKPILELSEIDFISLQYSECAQEIAVLSKETGLELHCWQQAIDDYDETAALVSALDLVISVQTAVVHLTGALGKPVWALIPSVPEWRYGASGHAMPWYPTARLFRQQERSAWEPLIASVRNELTSMLQARLVTANSATR